MGKPTDGTNAGSNIYTTAPFPNLRAPRIMIASFTGIERTVYGVSQGVPAAPNTNMFPERIDCTGWNLVNSAWSLNVDPFLLSFGLRSQIPAETKPYAFYFFDGSQANFTAENQLVDPETCCYVGGRLSLAWMDHWCPNSAFFLMDAFGIRRGPPVMLEQIPQPARKSVLRFADKRDSTCIRIKIDRDFGLFGPTPYWAYYPETHECYFFVNFLKTMDIYTTPTPASFTFCDIEYNEIQGVSCQWVDLWDLLIRFTTLTPPTENAYCNYTPGVIPIRTVDYVNWPSWNHLFFP